MILCSCGKIAEKVVIDSEVGPDFLCAKCAAKAIKAGNINEATVWEVIDFSQKGGE
jgi:hypothetical protein